MSNIPAEPEFEQAYKELSSTLENSTLFEQEPDYRRALQVISIPERVIQFRVVWEDDNHQLQVNRGYRVQFNSALGPYKGGLRFHPSVNLSVLKFLGFEQIFKNALTNLSMGGAKGGADFDPKDKSDGEIRRFCTAFATELSRHIGASVDVPAGDIGVTGKEIGFIFGQYKKLRNQWEGVVTGKGADWGGSHIRPEATGYGVVYYVEHMLRYVAQAAGAGDGSLKGKRVAISGSGNVAQYAALKVIELGGSVVSLSDSKGAVVATDAAAGISAEDVATIILLKERRRQLSSLFASDATTPIQARATYLPGARPWTHVGAVDIALPCATQNEVSGAEAKHMVAAAAAAARPVFIVAEGSNMGCTIDAIDVLEDARRAYNAKAKAESGAPAVWYGPGKAANSGGVAVSGLEMAQNSQRDTWTREQVDRRLHKIMSDAFATGLRTAVKYTADGKDAVPSLVAGSNIAGFKKVADAMRSHGDWW
ncbi:hypothetical protein KEM52_002185 [Ascosphaera acerosa]|nr:hypothetical protein KEM52_002185 [Ascosphaera acerosa]